MPRKKRSEVSRRDFLRLSGLATAGTLLAACGAQAPQGTAGTSAPAGAAATEAPAGAATAAPAGATTEAAATAAPAAAKAAATPTRVVPRGNAGKVAREKSFILMFSATDVGVGNPYAAGYTHQRGHAALMEPLFFYSAFASKEIPWLAESYKY